MGEFLRNVWDILGAILLLIIVVVAIYLLYLYFAAKRGEKPPKTKAVSCVVIEENQAERKKQEFAEYMEYLRKNNPKLAKIVWRKHILENFFIFLVVGGTFVLICMIASRLK